MTAPELILILLGLVCFIKTAHSAPCKVDGLGIAKRDYKEKSFVDIVDIVAVHGSILEQYEHCLKNCCSRSDCHGFHLIYDGKHRNECEIFECKQLGTERACSELQRRADPDYKIRFFIKEQYLTPTTSTTISTTAPTTSESTTTDSPTTDSPTTDSPTTDTSTSISLWTTASIFTGNMNIDSILECLQGKYYNYGRHNTLGNKSEDYVVLQKIEVLKGRECEELCCKSSECDAIELDMARMPISGYQTCSLIQCTNRTCLDRPTGPPYDQQWIGIKPMIRRPTSTPTDTSTSTNTASITNSGEEQCLNEMTWSNLDYNGAEELAVYVDDQKESKSFEDCRRSCEAIPACYAAKVIYARPCLIQKCIHLACKRLTCPPIVIAPSDVMTTRNAYFDALVHLRRDTRLLGGKVLLDIAMDSTAKPKTRHRHDADIRLALDSDYSRTVTPRKYIAQCSQLCYRTKDCQAGSIIQNETSSQQRCVLQSCNNNCKETPASSVFSFYVIPKRTAVSNDTCHVSEQHKNSHLANVKALQTLTSADENACLEACCGLTDCNAIQYYQGKCSLIACVTNGTYRDPLDSHDQVCKARHGDDHESFQFVFSQTTSLSTTENPVSTSDWTTTDDLSTTANSTDPTTADDLSTTSNSTDPTTSDDLSTTSNSTDPTTSDDLSTTSNSTDQTTSDDLSTTSNSTDPTTSDDLSTTSNLTDPTTSEDLSTTSNSTDPTTSDDLSTTSNVTDPTTTEPDSTSQSTTDPNESSTPELPPVSPVSSSSATPTTTPTGTPIATSTATVTQTATATATQIATPTARPTARPTPAPTWPPRQSSTTSHPRTRSTGANLKLEEEIEISEDEEMSSVMIAIIIVIVILVIVVIVLVVVFFVIRKKKAGATAAAAAANKRKKVTGAAGSKKKKGTSGGGGAVAVAGGKREKPKSKDNKSGKTASSSKSKSKGGKSSGKGSSEKLKSGKKTKTGKAKKRPNSPKRPKSPKSKSGTSGTSSFTESSSHRPEKRPVKPKGKGKPKVTVTHTQTQE